MTPDHSLTPPTRSNSKRIKGFNVRTETIKPLGENIDDKLPDIGLSAGFLDMTPKAKTTKVTKSRSGTTSNKKAFAQQRKSSTKRKRNLLKKGENFCTSNI